MEVVSDVRQQCQVTGLFDGLRGFTLVFEAGACQPTRQNFALRVAQHQQEITVLVIDVFDSFFAKAAVPLSFRLDVNGVQVANFLICHIG